MKEYRKLGEFIEVLNRRNTDMKLGLDSVRGISNTKSITETSKATVDENVISKFYVINPGEFIYNPRTTRMGDKVGLAFNNTDKPLLFTFNNSAFKIKDLVKDKLLPEYLYLFFCRSEFDRFARINSWGSATELFLFDDLCTIKFDPPDIKEQQKIVDTYNAITNRIRIKQKINENLSFQLSTFFEIESQKYTSENTKEIKLEEIVESKRINIKIDDIPHNSIYVGLEHIPRKTLVLDSFGSTDEVLSDKLKASKGDVLFGKIRPYFHKVSVNPYDEVYCSGDALVLNAINKRQYGFVLLTLFSTKFIDYAVKLSNGAKMPRAEWKDLKNYVVKLPDGESLERINNIVKKSLTFIFDNLEEISKLENIKQLVVSQISRR